MPDYEKTKQEAAEEYVRADGLELSYHDFCAGSDAGVAWAVQRLREEAVAMQPVVDEYCQEYNTAYRSDDYVAWISTESEQRVLKTVADLLEREVQGDD